mmetsp:Transcript_11067/g.35074  ORF Transcript_11067/g.35074 Transcript_11067/m.35074 type:complete len:259 (-) Transcript_11067:11-787(-)
MVVLFAEDRKRPQDLHTGRVARHEDHGLLLVQRAGEAGLAKQHEDLALRPNGARNPPLVPVDHVLVPIGFDPGRDVRRVGGRNARLGHSKGRANLAVQQGLQPLLLLLGRAEPLQDLHVPSVGGRTIHRQVCNAIHAQDLSNRRVLQDRHLGNLWKEKVHDSPGLRLRLELLEHRRLGTECVVLNGLHQLSTLLSVNVRLRDDHFRDKVDDLVADLVEARGQLRLVRQETVGDRVLVQEGGCHDWMRRVVIWVGCLKA